MAVSKLWSINEGGLSRVLQYAANPKKTNDKLYVNGINCELETAYEEFTAVKHSYAKTGGIEAYHGYLSFKEQDITPELTMKIGTEFAQEVWGKRFQILVTVHTDTEHPHCHFVINSVSFVDGKKHWGEEKAWCSNSNRQRTDYARNTACIITRIRSEEEARLITTIVKRRVNRQDTYSPVKRWKKRCCNAPTRQIYDIRSLNSVMSLL